MPRGSRCVSHKRRQVRCPDDSLAGTSRAGARGVGAREGGARPPFVRNARPCLRVYRGEDGAPRRDVRDAPWSVGEIVPGS
jgi:hypothetical protein